MDTVHIVFNDKQEADVLLDQLFGEHGEFIHAVSDEYEIEVLGEIEGGEYSVIVRGDYPEIFAAYVSELPPERGFTGDPA